jgi:hypothetical protein
MYATIMQGLDAVREKIRQQDESGIAPAQTVEDTGSRDERRAALYSGEYRPPCGCDPANGPTPCDKSILAVLSQEPIAGCANIDRGETPNAD